MKRTLLLLCVIVAGLAPVAARAGAPAMCVFTLDRVGDVYGTLDVSGVSDPDPAPAVDIHAVSLGSDADVVAGGISVGDIEASPSDPNTIMLTYNLSFSVGGTSVYMQALRDSSDAWIFGASAYGQGIDGEIPIDGEVDPAADSVTFLVSRDLLGRPADGRVVENVSVSASEDHPLVRGEGVFISGPSSASDSAPDMVVDRYALGDPCAPALEVSGERCVIAEDGANESDVVWGRAADPVDIRRVSLGSNDATLVIEIQVDRLDPFLPRDVRERRWELSWSGVSGSGTADAILTHSGVYFSMSLGDGERFTTGTFDPAGDAVEIVVPLGRFLFTGETMQALQASTYETRTLTTAPDTAPEYGMDASYVIGEGCSAA